MGPSCVLLLYPAPSNHPRSPPGAVPTRCQLGGLWAVMLARPGGMDELQLGLIALQQPNAPRLFFFFSLPKSLFH